MLLNSALPSGSKKGICSKCGLPCPSKGNSSLRESHVGPFLKPPSCMNLYGIQCLLFEGCHFDDSCLSRFYVSYGVVALWHPLCLFVWREASLPTLHAFPPRRAILRGELDWMSAVSCCVSQ